MPLHLPHHSHNEFQPLERNSIYELDVEVWPTSITLPACYRIALYTGGRDFKRSEALKDDMLSWREKPVHSCTTMRKVEELRPMPEEPPF